MMGKTPLHCLAKWTIVIIIIYYYYYQEKNLKQVK